jgi:UDP-N-acetyl-D-galactosamine dehydrogenase
MGGYIARELVKEMIRRGAPIKDCRILVMGLAFKENCPDLRNTRVVDIIAELRSYGASVDVWDPWVEAADAHEEYGLDLTATPATDAYDAIVLAVAHKEFAQMGAEKIRALGKPEVVVFDVKGALPLGAAELRL